MKNKIIIKNSIVCIGVQQDKLREVLAEFDLADKTPMDCMDFIRELKARGKKEEK